MCFVFYMLDNLNGKKTNETNKLKAPHINMFDFEQQRFLTTFIYRHRLKFKLRSQKHPYILLVDFSVLILASLGLAWCGFKNKQPTSYL